MSQLNVDTIKKADGTGNLSVPAETGTVVTTASPSLGRRNLIINGAMQVAQRGTSFTGLNAYGLDRWFTQGASVGSWTISQETDAPDEFGYSMKYLCTSGFTQVADTRLLPTYYFEGQNLQQLKYGTSDAQPITLSFWVKCNKTGVGQVNVRNVDPNRIIGGTYTVNSANTWEYKTITFSGDTSSSITNDNTRGLWIEWWLVSGSDFDTGSVPTSFESRSNPDRDAAGTLDLDATNDYWQITGVQLEVGDTATPFEHRSYGEELALCQRYYEKWFEYGDGSNTMIATMAAYDSGGLYGGIFFPYKRVKPSISFGPSSGDPFRQYGNNTYVALAASEMLAQDIGNRTARINADQSGQAVQGYAYFLQFINGLGGYIEFDSEL